MESLKAAMTDVGPVDRVASEPGGTEFFDRFVWESRPVVIRGLVASWERDRFWTLPALHRLLGEKPVKVTVSGGIYDFDRRTNNWQPKGRDILMRFSELRQRLESRRPGTPCLYLHQTSIADHFPELQGYVKVPSLVPDGALLAMNLWVGSSGNVSSLHFDQPNNFLVQLDGRKRLVLFDPFQLASLYPSAKIPHFSQVDLEQPDFDRFPDFRKARPREVILEAGDVLYLPPFWWHQVYSETASVSVNLFWKSYTHQLLAPAVLRTLPTLYRQIPAKYGGYLAGRLPRLVDFAAHAVRSGFEAAGTVFACSALMALLPSLAGEEASAAAAAGVHPYEDACRIGCRLRAEGRLPGPLSAGLEGWFEEGRRALPLVTSTASSEAFQRTVQEIGRLVAWSEGRSR